MTSLTEVYEGGSGGDDLRRLYLGVGLFLVGVVFALAGIVFATTGLGAGFGMSWWQQREVAGVLAGIGIPAVFLGVLTVLPASRFVRGAAVAGAAVATLGVLLFYLVYPNSWVGDPANYSLPVLGVYFLGAIATFWCLFTGVANFKTRNDPGGTVKLEITQGGETRVVEVEGDGLSRRLGGIGLLGATPDGEIQTQTAGSTARSDGGTTAQSANDTARPASEGAELLGEEESSDATDAYCGNCAHFSYVRTGDGLKPYCGYHEGLMDDMDPCPEWEKN
ncbi:phage holin family protein [Halomarina litorea]|uniref:phage holin family protein n=1 Tax=Halomarina litorea TaxID=2961595 RepID=UPI0020C39C72|nr:phage holin family protein [Halomarina sp. BCD28]